MGIAEDLADALAAEVIAAAQDLGDEDLITDISRAIGATSTTTQEAFMTAIRVRLSVERARRMLAERVARGPKGGPKREIGAGPILDAADGAGH